MTSLIADRAVAAPHAAAASFADLAQIAAALLLGMFIIGAVAFAPVPAIHNAAHDARHSFAFPCH